MAMVCYCTQPDIAEAMEEVEIEQRLYLADGVTVSCRLRDRTLPIERPYLADGETLASR